MPIIRIQRKPRLLPIIGTIVIIAAIVSILFPRGPGITEAGINRSLGQFAGYIAAQAAADGKDARFTYGSVAIEGVGYAKHAVVSNVQLQLSGKPPAAGDSWVITTPAMLVSADSTVSGGIIFAFPEPVSVTENGQPKVTLAFPSPLKYSYADTDVQHTHIVRHAVVLPPQVVLTPAGGGPITVRYSGTPDIRLDILPDTHERHAAYDFRNLRITTADGTEASAAALSSRLNEKPAADGRLQGNDVLTLTDFMLHDHDRISDAYSLAVNVSYDKNAPGTPDADDMKVNEFVLAGNDFKLRAEGKFATGAGDSLPSGVGNVVIDGLPQFLASELVPAQVRKPLASAINKAVGHEAGNHAEIVLRREKGGVFYVGGVTFESLVTSLLADLLTAPAATAPAAVLPPVVVPAVAVPAPAPPPPLPVPPAKGK